MLFTNIKSSKGPDTLANLSLECISRNLNEIFEYSFQGYELGEDLALPREICEALIESYQHTGKLVDDKFLNLFSDKKKTALQTVTIWNSSITDKGLKKILQHNVRVLDLAYCKALTNKSFDAINKYGANLRSLSIGSEVNIMSKFVNKLDNEKSSSVGGYNRRSFIFKMPNLTRLVLRDIIPNLHPSFYKTFLLSLPNLTQLDLSSCSDLGDLSYLTSCTNLISLTLFNCPNIELCIPEICELKKLRHLDISYADDREGIFSKSNHVLKRIIDSLPNLVSLDISGTNLAGKGYVETDLFDTTQKSHCDIPGLDGRVDNKLEFLGLYGTKSGACKRHHIPALKISGDANEEQIITAAKVYMHRPLMLQRVLNDLFHFLRADICINLSRVLQIILQGLNTHVQEKHIQISGSAALFYIVRNKNTHMMNTNIKKLVIISLLNGMTLHKNDETMIRNGCLTLCQFKIPQDILFVYNNLVELLLYIIMEKEEQSFEQRIGIYLMNSLACQVNDVRKETLGNLGIIENMLKLINTRIQQKLCDDILEVAWSTMWNVTDETPINCKRFLDNDGMLSFTGCLDFRQKTELMRNMMGLLGNVAEVKELRPRLMPYIKTFYELVDSLADGIEVSYNAAGVISHIASDGVYEWQELKRADVLNKMKNVIETWNIQSERNINYHSFEPILKLTRVWHTPECQHWAIWALANLTGVYPEKYCIILETEDGLTDVRRLIADSRPYARIKELAQMVLDNYQRYKDEERALQRLTEPMTCDYDKND